MIPRIIHYTWFSGEQYSQSIQECIDSWHKFMPDYEYVLWDLSRLKDEFGENLPLWVSEALSVKKWAFAADYIRLYAVEKYGGVYLDTDCKVLRSLDDMLTQSVFIGQEWYVHIDCYTNWRYLTSHCFGSVAHHTFIKRCLKYYDDRHFILTQDNSLPDNLHFDQTLLPKIQCQLAMQMYGYNPSPLSTIQCLSRYSEDECDSHLTVYPSSYFNPYDLKPHAYVVHLALGGWYDEKGKREDRLSLCQRIKVSFNYRLSRLMWHLGYIVVKKNR